MAGRQIRQTIEFDFRGKIEGLRKSVSDIQKEMGKVNLPTKNENTINKDLDQVLNKLKELESKNKDGMIKIGDTNEINKISKKISEIFTGLTTEMKNVDGLSDKLLPPEVLKRFNDLEKSLESSKNRMGDIIKAEDKINDAKATRSTKSHKLDKESRKTKISEEDYSNLKSFEDAQKKYKEIQESAKVNGKVDKRKYTKSDKEAIAEYERLKKVIEDAGYSSEKLGQTLKNVTTETKISKFQNDFDVANNHVKELEKNLQDLENASGTLNFDNLKKQAAELGVNIDGVTSIDELQNRINTFKTDKINEAKQQFNGMNDKIQEGAQKAENLDKKVTQEMNDIVDSTKRANNEFEHFKNQLQYFFGMANAIQLLKRTIREAFDSVKDLDSAMKEIAVVSDYDISGMWGTLPDFTKRANELGVAITEVYNATGLYVQQGLDLVESQGLANETLKMAKVAGMDAAAATDAMTSALRGFNMELNKGSAQKINDIYSKLAAITASDTQEIATAMSKTASIASNAGASIENTAAFLSQIIETTRESAETAGTALKTVIARFSELKKDPAEIGDVDGEIVDANQIESALKLANVDLRDAVGQFKNFDDVIIELSGKWDSLDKNTQRYIATMAAGSRQQSRFLALMSDNERLMQLTDAAYNSTGASQTQFNKTLDSMESKLNQLKNAWDTFTRNLMNSSFLKAGVDILTKILNSINGITDAFQNMGTAAGTILSGTLMATFFLLGKQLVTKLTASAKTGLVSFFVDVIQQFQTQTGLIGSEGANAGSQYGAQFRANFESSIQTWYQNFLLKIQELKSHLADLVQSMNASAGMESTALVPTATTQNNQVKNTPITHKKGMFGDIDKDGFYTAENGYKFKINKTRKSGMMVGQGGNGQTVYIDPNDNIIRGLGYNEKTGVFDPNLELGKAKRVDSFDSTSSTQTLGGNSPSQLQGQKAPLMLGDGSNESVEQVNKNTEKLHFNAQKTGTALVALGVASSFMAQQLRKNGCEEAAKKVEELGAVLTTAGMALTMIIPLISSLGKALKNMTATQMKSFGKWTIILAIATAAFMIIKNIVDIFSKNTLNGKLKSITDATQKATETAQKAQEAYSNWLSDKNDYYGLIEALEELTEGTVAWEEQMDKVQDKIYEMINTYPELAKYIKDGKIDDQGLQELDERLKKEKQLALSNKVGVQMTKDELQYQKDIKDLNKEKKENKDSSKDEDYWDKRFEELENNYNKTYQGNINFLLQNSGIDANLSDNITSALTKQNSSHNYGSETQKTIDQTGGKYNTHQSVENAAWWTAGGTAATMTGIGMINGAAALSTMATSATAAAAAAASGATAAAATAAGTAAATAAATAATGMAATAATTVATAATTAATAAATAAAGGATVTAAAAAGTAAAGGATTALVAGLGAIPIAGWVAAGAVAVTAITVGIVKAIQKNEKKKDIQKAYADMLGKSIEDIDEETLKDVDKMSAELAAYEQNKLIEYQSKITASEIRSKGPLASALFGNDMSLLDMDFSEAKGFENWVESLKQGTTELTQLSIEDAYIEFEKERKKITETVKDVFGDSVKLSIDTEVNDKSLKISGKTAQRLMNARESLQKTFGESAVKEMDEIMSIYAASTTQVEELSIAYSKLGESATITQKAVAATEMLESGQEGLIALATTFYQVNAEALSASNQVKQFYINLSSDKLNELFKNGKLTAKSIYELKDSFTDLGGIVDTTDINFATLGDALNDLRYGILSVDDLTTGFIETLDKLSKASHIIEDAMAKASSFKEPESGTIIGQKGGEIAKTLLTIYKTERFGDPALEKYFDQLLGEGAWKNAVEQANGNVKNAFSEYISTIKNLSEEVDYFQFWNNSVGISGGLWETDGEKITFHLDNSKDLDEFIDKIVKATGQTKEFITAALADAEVYSNELTQTFNSLNSISALNDYLNSLNVDNNRVQLDIQQLEKIYYEAFDGNRSIFATFTDFLADIQNKYANAGITTTSKSSFSFDNVSQIQNNLLKAKGEDDFLKAIQRELIDTYTYGNMSLTQDTPKRDNIKEVNNDDVEALFTEFIKKTKIDTERLSDNLITTIKDKIQDALSYDFSTMGESYYNLDIKTLFSSNEEMLEMYRSSMQEAHALYMKQGMSSLDAQKRVLEDFGKNSAFYADFFTTIADDNEAALQASVEELTSTSSGIASWISEGYSIEEANLIKQADLINRGTLAAVDYFINQGGLNVYKKNGKLKTDNSGNIKQDKTEYYVDEIADLKEVGINTGSSSGTGVSSQIPTKALFTYDNGILTFKGDTTDGLEAYTGTTEEDELKKAKEIDFDWLHNLNELGEKAVRDLEKLQSEYELGIKNLSMSPEQIADNWAGRIEAIQTETYVAQAKAAHAKTRAEGFYEKNKDELGEYISYDAEAGMTRINYDALHEAKTNGTLTERAKMLLEELEADTELINEAEQITLDNNLKQLEILEEIDNTIIDFENQVKDMIIESYQREIDKLSDIDSSINDANAKLISSIQSSVDRYRQDRENEETEQNITDMQNRLALLRADTTGANQQEITSLEKELDQTQEDYTDTLIDQKISALQEQNEEASAQRQQQIEIANAQLESVQESGQINKEMQALLEASQDFETSPLKTLWESISSTDGMSSTEWAQNIKQFKEDAAAFYGADEFKKKYKDANGINADLAAKMKTVLNSDTLKINKALEGWKLKTDTDVKNEVNNAIKEYDTEQQITSNDREQKKQALLSHVNATRGNYSNSEDFVNYIKETQEYKDYKASLNYSANDINGDKYIVQSLGLDNALENDDKPDWGRGLQYYGNGMSSLGRQKIKAGYYSMSTPIEYKKHGVTTLFQVTDSEKDWKIYSPKDKKFHNSNYDILLDDYYNKNHKVKYLGTSLPLNWENNHNSYTKFKTGGLNTFTGPAWLDGTPSKPELVLNAQDTQNFLQLKDILSSIMGNGFGNPTTQKDGDINLEIYLNVEQGISSDYDVEQLVSKVKQEIARVGQERNIQILTKR